MIIAIHSLRSLCIAALAALTGCSSTPVSYDGASPDSVRLHVTTVSVTGGANEILSATAMLDNGTAANFQRLGCLRPAMAIDSATATGWVELSAVQSTELALCFSPYYIVAAHSTQIFETSFVRKSPATTFPRGVALRVRIVGPTQDSGPTAPVVLTTR